MIKINETNRLTDIYEHEFNTLRTLLNNCFALSPQKSLTKYQLTQTHTRFRYTINVNYHYKKGGAQISYN